MRAAVLGQGDGRIVGAVHQVCVNGDILFDVQPTGEGASKILLHYSYDKAVVCP